MVGGSNISREKFYQEDMSRGWQNTRETKKEEGK